MPLKDVPTISVSLQIAAPPQRVWDLVSDPRNMTRWSPQTWRSFLRGGTTARLGSRFLNINRRGILVWPTRSKIVRFEEEREVAWRIKDNFAIWSLRLSPDPEGTTTLVQSREAPDGLSDISVRLTKRFFGGVDNFAEELRADMLTTLTRIKQDAEA